MTELQQLNLTEKDFDLIIEGLDSIQEKGLAGDLIFGLMGAMMSKDNPEAEKEFKSQREKDRLDREKKVQEQKEEVRILQGKLLMLKRYLISQAALRESVNIINHIQ